MKLTDKGLISKTSKQLTQLNTRKTNNPIKKWEKDLNRHFSKEDVQIANIWKDAQHHSLLEKCKSKLHWNITNITGEISPVRMAIIKKSTNNKCWRGCGLKRTLLHYWWECKLIQPLWKTVWRFLKKNLGIKIPYDLAIPLLGMYPKETKIEKDICILLFIAMLFTIARM